MSKSDGLVMVNLTLFQEPIPVPPDEVPVLRAQGLIRPDPAPEPPVPVPVPVSTAKSTPTARKDSTS